MAEHCIHEIPPKSPESALYSYYKLLSLQCNLLGLSDPLSIPVARPTAGLIMIIKEAPFTYFVKLMRPGGLGRARTRFAASWIIHVIS